MRTCSSAARVSNRSRARSCIPCDRDSLLGPLEAARRKLIIPVLVGPEAKIRPTAEAEKVDISAYRIVDTEHSHAAAQRAVAMARTGEVEALMKGSLHTDELMAAVVPSATGLRTERRISHAFVLDVPAYPRPLIVTESGLLGVSGISSDMRTLLESNDPRAKLATDLFCYRIGRELGSLAAALGGLDAVVFTAGIGENSADIRARVCRDAA